MVASTITEENAPSVAPLSNGTLFYHVDVNPVYLPFPFDLD